MTRRETEKAVDAEGEGLSCTKGWQWGGVRLTKRRINGGFVEGVEGEN